MMYLTQSIIVGFLKLFAVLYYTRLCWSACRKVRVTQRGEKTLGKQITLAFASLQSNAQGNLARESELVPDDLKSICLSCLSLKTAWRETWEFIRFCCLTRLIMTLKYTEFYIPELF